MDISSEIKDSITVVRLEGNLDTNTSTDAQVYLNKAINEGASKVVVCFETVDFVSSAGLRVLLATAKKLGGVGGDLRICGLNETVSEIFEISGFSTILNVFPSEAEALADF
jgi:anti-sigma B factor antagonist